jgi:hypothetical protein
MPWSGVGSLFCPNPSTKFELVMRIPLLLSAAAAVAFTGAAFGASLSLDFQPTGGTTAVGYLPFEATNQSIPAAGTSYPVFGTTVTVSLSVANLPDGALDFRSVTRNGAVTSLTNDWIGVDTRNAGTNVTMIINVAGLPAGAYNWLSTHHDGGPGATNGNIQGLADIIFVDASGSTGLVANGITISSQNAAQPIATFSRNFTANGTDPVSLSMIMDNGQGNAANGIFALANGLVIDQIPEPSSALLALAGVAALVRRRRR